MKATRRGGKVVAVSGGAAKRDVGAVTRVEGIECREEGVVPAARIPATVRDSVARVELVKQSLAMLAEEERVARAVGDAGDLDAAVVVDHAFEKALTLSNCRFVVSEAHQ